MHIETRIKFVTYAFIALLFLLAGMSVVIMLGVSTLTTSAGWAEHSNYVQRAIKEYENAVGVAETQGRLAVVDQSVRNELPAFRKDALAKGETVRELVADNGIQNENLLVTEKAVAERFAAQDGLISAAIVTNGKLEVNSRYTLESVETQSRLNNAFNNLKSQENILLFERYAAMNVQQWRIVKFIIFLLGLMFATSIGAFYLTIVTLKRSKIISDRLQENIIHSSVNGSESVLVATKEIQGLVDLIIQNKQA